ncbi:MAG: 50S ribosomal protein L29 [Anaerolineales bacterium]|nr:50S ribosomal protein L29 [Anaerolineales bacterium]
MKVAEIRKLSEQELKVKMEEARENHLKLRFQQSTGQLTDHSQLQIARKEIARFETILREREIAAKAEGSEA